MQADLRRILLAGGSRNGHLVDLVFVLGAVSIGISAVIHLHLWMTGYSGIHIIGPLFLVQSIGGLMVAALVIAVRRVWVAAIGAGYLLLTAGGFLISLWIGLFGFQDTWSAPFALAAFWTEVVGAVVLAAAGTVCVIERLADA